MIVLHESGVGKGVERFMYFLRSCGIHRGKHSRSGVLGHRILEFKILNLVAQPFVIRFFNNFVISLATAMFPKVAVTKLAEP